MRTPPPPAPLAREPPPPPEPAVLLRSDPVDLRVLAEVLLRAPPAALLRALSEADFRALAEGLRRAPAGVLLGAGPVDRRALDAALLRVLPVALLRADPALLRAGLLPVRELGEPAFGRDACWARAGVPRRIARASDLIRSGLRRLDVPVTPRLRNSPRRSSTRNSARSASRMLPPARLMIAVAERDPEPRVELARAEPALRLDRFCPFDLGPFDAELRRRVLVC
ncbi:hypothetical protein [Micromonospora sp. LOL_023]|uniref:hypothetical protein n=1 Tax=Micromonospora sp. LOL_023 TaxID=3345418 RepID=UPI003A894703